MHCHHAQSRHARAHARGHLLFELPSARRRRNSLPACARARRPQNLPGVFQRLQVQLRTDRRYVYARFSGEALLRDRQERQKEKRQIVTLPQPRDSRTLVSLETRGRTDVPDVQTFLLGKNASRVASMGMTRKGLALFTFLFLVGV